MKVKGKRVVITGAASGIGKALAVAFHSAGAAAVMASDINKAGVQAVAAEIKSEGIVTDVTNEEDIIRLIKESNDNYGGIDIFLLQCRYRCLRGFSETNQRRMAKNV
ncbi:MAG: hypothetical protein CM1200mP10_02320 [Candidatus Neomarinimicrobiota bacterium]|nr:MAG: hypothetical protein CM1200mP10_02320 [Candidatus Neomarinimicrobiota bacterium]